MIKLVNNLFTGCAKKVPTFEDSLHQEYIKALKDNKDLFMKRKKLLVGNSVQDPNIRSIFRL